MRHVATVSNSIQNTNFMESLDVKTACDVATPTVVPRILCSTGVHGHVAAALLAEMQDVQGSACFENCETEFRHSRCIRQGRCCVVGTRGQIRVMESRGKVEGQRLGTYLRRRERQRVRAAKHDVG